MSVRSNMKQIGNCSSVWLRPGNPSRDLGLSAGKYRRARSPGVTSTIDQQVIMISDPEINDPEEGEMVRYIPDHADGPQHRDSEVGEVTNVGEAGIMVDFENEPKRGAKLCYRRNLIRIGKARA